MRLQVSHLVPRNGLESARRCVELVDGAAAGGMDVAFDMHTRLYGTTFLLTALPPWALEDPARLREILGSKEQRRAMRDYVSILSAGRRLEPHRAARQRRPGPTTRGATSPRSPPSAARTRSTPSTTCCSARPTIPGSLMVIIHAYTEEQQREAFAHPLCVPGLGRDDDGAERPARRPGLPRRLHLGRVVPALLRPAGAGAEPAGGDPPADRAQPAERIGLPDRGVLRAGAHADVAVFDPLAFREEGTTFDPSRLATGMDTVIVNGVVTLSGGELTGSRNGAVLARAR